MLVQGVEQCLAKGALLVLPASQMMWVERRRERKDEESGSHTHHKGHHFLPVVIERLPPFLRERLEGVREGHTGPRVHVQESADHLAHETLSASGAGATMMNGGGSRVS